MNSPGLSQIDGKLTDGLQFCAKVYELFENIRAADDGPSRLRMRASGLEKKLVEELLPICKYVQSKYRTGRYISVRWVDGNQQFDAEVFQRGSYVEVGDLPATAHLEVTGVMHPNEYLLRERIDRGGVAFGVEGVSRSKKTRLINSRPVVRRNLDFIQPFCSLVLGQINKKSGVSYPSDTTLIVQCWLTTLYTPDEWEVFAASVGDGLPSHNFREIFMYDAVSEYFCSFYSR